MQKKFQGWKALILRYLLTSIDQPTEKELESQEGSLSLLKYLQERLDKNGDIRKIILEFDIRRCFKEHRPIFIERGGFQINPLNRFESSFFKQFYNLKFLQISEEDLDTLKYVLKDEEVVRGTIHEKGLVFSPVVKQKGKKENITCICGKSVSDSFGIFILDKEIYDIFTSPGKLLEYFVFLKLTLFFKNNLDIDLIFNPNLRYLRPHFFRYGLSLFKKREIDIFVKNKKTGKEIIIFATINPKLSDEKESFRICNKLGYTTFMISTKDKGFFDGYMNIPTDSKYLFPEVHKEDNVIKFLNEVKEVLT